MSGEIINISNNGGKIFNCYYSKKIPANGPVIIMIHGIVISLDWTKKIADYFAEQGYLVIVPDLLWHLRHNFSSEFLEKQKYFKVSEHKKMINDKPQMDNMASIISFVKTLPECNGKVGVVGFGDGGTLAYLAAAQLKINAAVAYYGPQIHEYIQEGRNITCPIFIHMGERDDTFSAKNRNKIHSALIGKPNVSIYMYDAKHNFSDSYDPINHSPEAAIIAHNRTFKLLNTLKY